MSETIAEIPFFSKSMMKIELDKDQVERANRFNTELLKNYVGSCPNDWPKDKMGVNKLDELTYAGKHWRQVKMHDHTKDLRRWIIEKQHLTKVENLFDV